ncbi:3-(3-hydroxy-phenyl)propionate/3-hydroxycinnamic acid hydroxylase [Chlamydia avium]|uniref:FAD binding domain protein n=1 Tax=Chlamydia avium TaxID=1457141 RepID=A0ABP2X5R1_9CHLA|nr:FAD-dependent monooxygenase [Chlamydia avium]EPP37328.1 FAD binding domain protein [Chlamydia psittaci 10_743_SC13]EPP38076.1 FAD binding domain protein [Chlamydia avium]VVT42862.1 3-(3-hydroxy-phenyl)propionate/3-hydroxycinnamic acid hydroxylase [Chlamydia avium]
MTDVLVIGANPTGIILASLLVQHGVSVKVIDHRDSSDEPGYLDCRELPVILSCSSLELLDNAGLLENFVDKGHKIFGARYHWKKRTILFKFNQASESRFPFCLSTSYQAFSRHLIQQFEKHGGTIQWNTRPVTLVDNSIFIEKTKTSQNFENREIYNPKWIIASETDTDPDVKDLFKTQIKFRKHVKDILFVHCDEGEPFEESHIHLVPCSKSFLNFVFYNHEKGSKQLCLTNTSYPLSVKSRRQLLYNYKLAVTDDADAYYHIRAQVHQYPTDYNNFLFLGSVLNNLTFSYLTGINTNIHAAFNLAWKLVPVVKKAASKYLVTAKEHENGNILPHLSEKRQRQAKKLLFSNLYAPALMYYFLKGCRLLEVSGGEYYYPAHKALKYQNSEIIKISPQDREIRGPSPGMRAINVQLENGSYLLDSLKSIKHLLIFFKDRTDLEKALREEYGTWLEVIVTKDPKVFSVYHANPDSLFIIRPDCYIGYRTHKFKLHELISYLLRIFATEKTEN